MPTNVLMNFCNRIELVRADAVISIVSYRYDRSQAA